MTWRERAEIKIQEYVKVLQDDVSMRSVHYGTSLDPAYQNPVRAVNMPFDARVNVRDAMYFFEAGRNDAREEAKALVEAAKYSIHVMLEYNFNNSDSFKIRAMYLDLTKALKDWDGK